MKPSIVLAIPLVLLTSLVHAGTLIECRGESGEILLRLRAEKKNLRGAPSFEKGGWWMELRGQTHPAVSGPNSSGPKIDAKAINRSDVDITIEDDRTPSGPVGQRLELRDLTSETPLLTLVTFGGVVGRLEMGPFQCVKTESSCAKAMTSVEP